MWYSLFPALFTLNRQLVEEYSRQYHSMKKERIFHQFIGSRFVDPDLGAYNHSDTGTEQRNRARSKRQGGFYKNLLECDSHRIEAEKQFEKAECVPIVFEETFIRTESMEESMEPSTAMSSELMKEGVTVAEEDFGMLA